METKDIILETAFICFMNSGLDGVSLNDIIKRSGLTKGAFYHYFKSKDELVNEIIEKYLYSCIEIHVDGIRDSNENSFEKIKILVDSITNVGLTLELEVDDLYLKEFQIFIFNVMIRNDSLKNINNTGLTVIHNLLVSIIEDGQKSALIKPLIDPIMISNLIQASVLGSVYQFMIDYGESVEKKLKDNIDTIIELIRV